MMMNVNKIAGKIWWGPSVQFFIHIFCNAVQNVVKFGIKLFNLTAFTWNWLSYSFVNVCALRHRHKTFSVCFVVRGDCVGSDVKPFNHTWFWQTGSLKDSVSYM